ncbi:zinc ABC transporter substrate-binding protein [Rapidithrix thailandica]|uniref:Zinc ABC transporter substrate-binding protein n=1 Tax=Rapidithrix thailandica TaxID=413964 RepID=A0AAW9RZR6_9BACT
MKKYILLLLFSITLLLTGCNSSTDQTNHSKDTPYVVATTGMLGDAIRNIAGDFIKVDALMGPGVDPHLYKPTMNDLSKLREADAIFYNGLHLEGKMVEVLDKLNHEKPTIPVASYLKEEKLIVVSQDGNHKTYDPHIWFDVALWLESIRSVPEKLCELDPEHCEAYRQNFKKYEQQLQSLHEWTSAQIASIPQESRVMITAHDAFTYFGKAYDIEVRGLQGISTVAEFGLKDVTELKNYIVQRKIKAVFVESSVPTKSLEAVVSGCQEQGHPVQIGGTLFSDAMGANGTPEGTYIGMVKANVNTIVHSLK